jgi:hypothetical protein
MFITGTAAFPFHTIYSGQLRYQTASSYRGAKEFWNMGDLLFVPFLTHGWITAGYYAGS